MKIKGQKFASARKLRSAGWSYNEIIKHLGVAKSTLSGWLKDVELSEDQRAELRKKWNDGLKLAREHSADAHRKKTKLKFEIAIANANKVLNEVAGKFYETNFFKLFLAFLYLGEGAKCKSLVCFANSNPDICKAFIGLLRKTYIIDEDKFRCHLHLRTDQNINELISYWSRLLQIPVKKFHKTQVDKRTEGKKSNENYMGVCAIYYYDASLQKDLLSLGKVALKKIILGS